jgi:pSer/pThr/pTyr-binding forkhead associated (FHA) protein
MEPKGYKFCPCCHLINRQEETICQHCGQPLESASGEYLTTAKVQQETRFFPKGLEEKLEKLSSEAPAKGIAIYLLNQTDPIEVRMDDEFIIGRSTGEKEEGLVDLSPFRACDLGVSRRHLLVRRAVAGYSVIDLFSTNGTWVNELSLLPQHPFTVKSGSQIRLGKMRIFIAFREQVFEEQGQKGSANS